MPTRQDVFKLVPTTLVNTTGPRPPMTSKAAKKAYREANKLPKISKAEQRRIEAAEIARQKKEYEKEKAAAKAKAARERKLKKEAEEKAKRKQLGLPEPSRFVRPSQPTINTFVKSGAGRKRCLEEVDSVEEHADTENDDHNELQLEKETMNLAKRTAHERGNEDDEYGDFPSLSQAELPTLFAVPDETSRTISIQSSPSKPPCKSSTSQAAQSEVTERFPNFDQTKINTEMAESQFFTEALLARPIAHSVQQDQAPTMNLKIPSSLSKIMTEAMAMSSPIPEPHVLKTSNSAIPANGSSKSVDERSRTMLPPAIPMTVNRLRSRIPLNETSRNIVPPPRPSKINAFTSKNSVRAKSDQRPRRENSSIPPPSTLAFLEANLDDLFPSPSQQIRELLEDVDDMPSNTQIAREIDLEPTAVAVRVSHIPNPRPQSQAGIEDEALQLLSSQDLEISSQDLRDIDTPSKAMPRGSLLRDLTSQMFVLKETTPTLPPTPKLKPRFFEEKEADLLYAALHESLLLSKQTTQSSSPRRSQRILRRTQSATIDHGCDDYGSDGSDLDAEFLALLDGA